MPRSFSDLEIIVVDDNHQMLQLMRTLLRSLGVRRVFLAGSVAEAMNEITRAPPDIVMTDWEMLPVSGIDFVAQLRAHYDPLIRRLPVIMVTAHSERRLVEQARDTGVHDFLVKPVSLKSVSDRIVALMRSPRPFIRAPGYFGPERRRADRAFSGSDRRQNANDFVVSVEEGQMQDAENEIAILGRQFENTLTGEVDRLQAAYTQGLADEAGRTAAMAALFKLAHDLKGQGSTFGYPLITEFGESLCRFIEARKGFGPRELTLVKAHVDAMATVAKNKIRGDGGNLGRALTQQLGRLVEKFSQVPT